MLTIPLSALHFHAHSALAYPRPPTRLVLCAASTASTRLDAACAAAAGGVPQPGEQLKEQLLQLEERSAEERASERRKQEELLGCYRELQAGGELRAFASALGALPAPEPKVVDAATQQRLTGLAPSAFAPPKSNRFEGAIAGGLLVGGLAVARALEVDPRPFVGVPTALLLADRALLRGLPSEAITRALNPEYRRTVVAHEAGHFLCAYLLGCPVQACLLDPVAALRDGRVNGAAGTVFFDPELGESMEKGSLARSVIDRYCVVVMGGIAAEAERNQQAEGGRSDEAALINLLSSLDGGRTWDIARIQSQARWAASQACFCCASTARPSTRCAPRSRRAPPSASASSRSRAHAGWRRAADGGAAASPRSPRPRPPPRCRRTAVADRRARRGAARRSTGDSRRLSRSRSAVEFPDFALGFSAGAHATPSIGMDQDAPVRAPLHVARQRGEERRLSRPERPRRDGIAHELALGHEEFDADGRRPRRRAG